MNSSSSRPKLEAGFTLVELMIAMVVLSGVMASAVAVLRSQSAGFRRGSLRTELTQNVRYAVGTLDRTLRTLGSGVVPRQPMLIYGGNSAIVFNANFATDGVDVEDGNAVYSNPDLPAGATISMLTTAPLTIYGTAITYPAANYTLGGVTPSRAETIMFYFTPDGATADPNDFALMQQVNTQPPELVARNIRAYPGRPFFQYWYEKVDNVGVTTSLQLPAASVPVRHTDPQHGSTTDIGASALADSVRMVRVNLLVTNGATGAELRSQQLSTMIRVPNNGLVQLQSCGDRPVTPGGLLGTATNLAGDPPSVRLQWTSSPDEIGGQKDVSQYNLYYRLVGNPAWEVFSSLPAGSNPYDFETGEGLVGASSYFFAVTAQDCSPRESAMVATVAQVDIP
ncbi:MAG: prepilin-type N-terminal cleavage/methylation domain-containing protein [Gemmatimonadales bacterium]|nr:prepilin-type N-terminal cleavage/methylation domain-containing protein [Gemmatimonadales bacterium]